MDVSGSTEVRCRPTEAGKIVFIGWGSWTFFREATQDDVDQGIVATVTEGQFVPVITDTAGGSWSRVVGS